MVLLFSDIKKIIRKKLKNLYIMSLFGINESKKYINNKKYYRYI